MSEEDDRLEMIEVASVEAVFAGREPEFRAHIWLKPAGDRPTIALHFSAKTLADLEEKLAAIRGHQAGGRAQ